MTDRFESILDESISALQAGVPIEDILAEVPDYAAELRPLLYAATLVANPNPELIPDERKAALRAEYLQQAADLTPVSSTYREKFKAVSRIIRRRASRKAVVSDLVTITVTIILTLAMVAIILNFMAADSIPGDFLYGVKRGSENIQLIFTLSEERRQALIDEFNNRRIDEIDKLMEENRAAVVEFRGTLEARGEDLWIVEGYNISLPPDVDLEGDPQEGNRVEVIGFLRKNNLIVADSIKKID